MKNIIEPILEEFDKEFPNNWLGECEINPKQAIKHFIRSSLQKAINDERERCLGCVPESWPPGEYKDCNCNMCWAFNKCRQEVINKIKGE